MQGGELEAALHSVIARVERYERTGEPEAVMELGTLPDAAPLWHAAMSAQGTSLEVMQALARLHWARSKAHTAKQWDEDRFAAILLYARIGCADARLVPAEVMNLLRSEPTIDHRFLGPHSWGWRATDMLKRQMYTNDLAELDEVVDLFRASTMAYPPDHQLWYGDMSNLVLALRLRYERRSDPADLDRAIRVAESALRTGDPSSRTALQLRDNYSATLARRAKATGDILDATKAVELSKQVMGGILPSDPQRHLFANSLAVSLATRYELTGDLDDIQSAVTHAAEAVTCAPVDDPGQGAYRSNLGTYLLAQFEATGRLELLNSAVESLTKAVTKVGSRHADRSLALMQLGLALHTRYERSGDRQDLHDAVNAVDEALQIEDERSVRRPGLLNTRGHILCSLGDVTGDRGYLDAAVESYREALRRTPSGHPERALLASNLGNALLERHAGGPFAVRPSFGAVRHLSTGSTGKRLPAMVEKGLRAFFREPCDASSTDLAEAAEAHRLALEEAGPHHPGRASYLNNQGNSARARFLATREESDGEHAAELYRQVRGMVPSHHPAHPKATLNLADTLLQLGSERVEEALFLLRELAGELSAPPSLRIHAASSWGRAEGERGRWQAALEGYAVALDLLPSVASRGLDREVREERLSDWSGLATEAASCAIAASQPNRALELLEQGRGVLWSQLLDARDDMAALRAADPHLADRLADVEAALDASPQASAGSAEAGGDARWWARAADRRLALAAEYSELLAQASALPGLIGFRRPWRAEQLRRATAGGPVVLVVTSRWRCDALMVDETDTRVVPLTALEHATAVQHGVRYLMALQRYEASRRDETARVALNLAVSSTLHWLWDTVADPVLTALGRTAPPGPEEEWPRVWWCPTGSLALLPVHAACRATPGGLDAPDQADAVMDRVVSSYTPTLRALLESRADRTSAQHPGRVLAVGMPETAGQAPLPQVEAELAGLRARFPDITELRGKAATCEAVRESLRTHAWVHLSCHGGQNLDRPSQGSLLLADGSLSIADLYTEWHAHGEFAFLSACRTALGGAGVPDEAITMASAMQYVGWQHVIGTLWSVGADTAAELCSDVYDTLTAKGNFRPALTAEALHKAVRALRADDDRQPARWAAFIHSGA
ncbi:CHAT domain-containing protein [Streptomyces puniciscabiei]|uniref:CHAT domain-containing protein n=1 Tax=Streptomyces puniciscabiei TaxID=164348 RepID=UPI00378759FD